MNTEITHDIARALPEATDANTEALIGLTAAVNNLVDEQRTANLIAALSSNWALALMDTDNEVTKSVLDRLGIPTK